jgi:hypothetical protein
MISSFFLSAVCPNPTITESWWAQRAPDLINQNQFLVSRKYQKTQSRRGILLQKIRGFLAGSQQLLGRQ